MAKNLNLIKRIFCLFLIIALTAFLVSCFKNKSTDNITSDLNSSVDSAISDTEEISLGTENTSQQSQDTSKENSNPKDTARNSSNINNAPNSHNSNLTTSISPSTSSSSDPNIIVTPPKNTNNGAEVHVKNISFSVVDMECINEPKPYAFGVPYYQMVFQNSRTRDYIVAQIGDTIKIKATIAPADTTDTIITTLSNNLEIVSVGDDFTYTVKVKSTKISNLSLQIKAMSGDQEITRKIFTVLVTESQRDPLIVGPMGYMSTYVYDYLRLASMDKAGGVGYTYHNPALSITGYGGEWDDKIDKNDSDLRAKCFRLIDEYKKRGFRYIRISETDDQILFSGNEKIVYK